MLKKVNSQSEPARLVLLADPSVWEAQLAAARREVDRELGEAEEKDIIEKMISLVKATTSTHQELIESLAMLKTGGVQLVESIVKGKDQQSDIIERLDTAIRDEDTRTALAYVRAHGICQMYRETSNIEHLLDQAPAEATWIEVKGLSRTEIKAAERSLPPRPSLGAILSSKALDTARKAVRRQEDSSEAYARYVSTLTVDEQIEIRKFEEWNEALDQEIARRSLVKVDGFNLEAGANGYPIAEFIEQCAESGEVFSEVARHARQVSTSDLKAGSRLSSQSGTPESEGEAVV